ncbi:hypothetical protein BRADI_3g15346v3 [Brachypodium distachyon]|uniref:Uncharacterized protein n=1 Tax=Brachypodium distachyon TaxID=15368 RepID=A0A2K2CXA8_BRADI|nr:hypothetical protein BRADI_3g15346v3 [Brachypodium distachyon]
MQSDLLGQSVINGLDESLDPSDGCRGSFLPGSHRCRVAQKLSDRLPNSFFFQCFLPCKIVPDYSIASKPFYLQDVIAMG